MNKEQFRRLVERLDLEDLYWSEQLMSRPNPITNPYLSEINTVYVIFNPQTEKVEKIIYSTPRETYIYTNLKESYNGKFYGFGKDDWYFDEVNIDGKGSLQFGLVTDELRIHPFRYRNIPLDAQNEGRGWQLPGSDTRVGFILNIGMRKWMNWDKEPWSDVK